jgi:hypothetical protein
MAVGDNTMRIVLVVVFVAAIAASGRAAQAPAWDALPAPAINTHEVGGRLTGYEITFADGSVLKADNMARVDMTPPGSRPTFGIVGRDLNSRQGSATTTLAKPYGMEDAKPLPHPLDFDLSGNVRLTIPVR